MSSETFHIIAVDPGLMCGIAVLTVNVPPSGDGYALTQSSSEKPWLETVTYVDAWLRAEQSRSITVRSERYDIPTGRSVVTAQQEAIKTNGALEYICSLRGITFGLQPRAEVKRVVNDRVLRHLGWHKKTKDGHANDASRHAGFELMQSHPEMWLRLTAGL